MPDFRSIPNTGIFSPNSLEDLPEMSTIPADEAKHGLSMSTARIWGKMGRTNIPTVSPDRQRGRRQRRSPPAVRALAPRRRPTVTGAAAEQLLEVRGVQLLRRGGASVEWNIE